MRNCYGLEAHLIIISIIIIMIVCDEKFRLTKTKCSVELVHPPSMCQCVVRPPSL